ncbi:25878_t:CDS:2, partial [Racocetra persica]
EIFRVTGHFITPNFELKEVTLAIKNLLYPHTDNHIQEVLEMIISDWNINDKVFCYTIDNRKNMKNTNIADKSINESQLVFYHALTDCEIHWSSTFNAWSHLLILKPFIDIFSTAMNVNNVDTETRKDEKQLEKLI